MVDGLVTPGADGKPAWAPRPEEELARIASLVRSAVGYDEKRGDRIEVVSMRFTVPEEGPEAAAQPIWAQLDKSDIVRLVEAGLLTLAVILCLAFVFRPMVLRIALAQPQLAGPGGAAIGADGSLALAGSEPHDAIAGAAGVPALPGAAQVPDELVRMANVEGELRIASLRRVADLVSAHPDETLSMVRNWIVPDDR